METFKAGQEFCKKIVDGLNFAATPYHMVARAKAILTEAGFKEIHEKYFRFDSKKNSEPWTKLVPGDKYFLTRNLTSLMAFSIGQKFDPKTSCLKIVATHTDSPCIKFSPIAKMGKAGYLQPAVQLYGGGIWHTWFDRDLTLAGKITVRNPKTKALEYKLFHYKDALLRIPNLAIHFTRVYDKFEFNLENHLRPFLATDYVDKLEAIDLGKDCEIATREFPVIVKLVAKEIDVNPADIVDMDLNVIDSQPATMMGPYKEFISSPRIDNQISCHCGLEVFKDLHSKPEFLANDKDINILAMFDHEEIGSKSQQGALSIYLSELTKRIFSRAALSTDNDELYTAALRRSFLLSADLAHATNPNYADKHQEVHPVAMHKVFFLNQIMLKKGVVVKTNYNISYATDSVSSVILKEIAKKGNVPLQEFVVKCDSLCGTTVGPLLNTNTGIKTVDIGIGQLAMHSIRETCATTDVLHYYNLMKAFFQEFAHVDKTFLGC